jgi:hypothetical protein
LSFFQFSCLTEPPMPFRPLSNHQNVVNPWDSRLNFYEGTILVSEFVNCVWTEGSWGWRSTTTVSAPGAPVYRWQRLNQSVLRIFPRYSVVTRKLLPAEDTVGSKTSMFLFVSL